MKAKVMALIFVGIVVLLGASTQLLARGPAPSISYRSRNSSPEPGPLPDLIIKSATFYFKKAVVVVQNVGDASSGKTSLALLILSGIDPLSKVQDTFNKAVPALNPGQKFTAEFDIGSLTFQEHARKVMVDYTKAVAESNENNNNVFSNSLPVAEPADFPNPSPNLSNLTFSMVKFIAPNSVHYCVKNIGNATSVSYKVRTTIFSGPKKDSGLADMNEGPYQKNPFSIPGNSLKSLEVACQDFTFATVTGESALEGRGRLVEIILDKGAKDSDSTDKSYFSPGIEGLWQKKN